uniref:Uncharacterized protein n=1 Tax=Setaria italica TaxID=4555 RepID=K3Z1N0_SETIT
MMIKENFGLKFTQSIAGDIANPNVLSFHVSCVSHSSLSSLFLIW